LCLAKYFCRRPLRHEPEIRSFPSLGAAPVGRYDEPFCGGQPEARAPPRANCQAGIISATSTETKSESTKPHAVSPVPLTKVPRGDFVTPESTSLQNASKESPQASRSLPDQTIFDIKTRKLRHKPAKPRPQGRSLVRSHPSERVLTRSNIKRANHRAPEF
jgi:hypothetical protein